MEKFIVFTNVPWTQVVLAICALIGCLIALFTIFHRLATAKIRSDIRLILRNHLPHLDAKINLILDHLKIPHTEENFIDEDY